MQKILPKKVMEFAMETPSPLYLVGGATRNFLAGLPASADYDLSGAFSAEAAAECAKRAGLIPTAVYPRTGTARLSDGEFVYEYTSFRRESYAPGGGHAPERVTFDAGIEEDARRRDFTANAVYYDIKGGGFVDPLGGIADVKARVLRAFEADRVFQSDGLRLLRLARFAAELNFDPDPETLASARKNADNIRDISGERVLEEVKKMAVSDVRYPASHPDPSRAFRILKEIGVLGILFPFTEKMEGMAQRADFHDHDVLEHTFRAISYTPAEVVLRLAALFHDSGKPATERGGSFYGHEEESARLAEQILGKYKASNALKEEVAALCEAHMFDLKGQARPITRRRFLIKHVGRLDRLFSLMQADFSACKDDPSPAPTVTRLKAEWKAMQEEGVPLSVKDLALSAEELIAVGFCGKEIGEAQRALWEHCVVNPSENRRARLIDLAERRRDRIKTS